MTDRDIDQLSRKANYTGLELAAKPGVCNYLNFHPEEVATLRLSDQIASP